MPETCVNNYPAFIIFLSFRHGLMSPRPVVSREDASLGFSSKAKNTLDLPSMILLQLNFITLEKCLPIKKIG
jgi:hypothetical protein